MSRTNRRSTWIQIKNKDVRLFQLTKDKIRIKDFITMRKELDRYEALEEIMDRGLTI